MVEDDDIDIGGRCGRYVMSTEEDGQGVSEEGGDAAALASLVWMVDDIAGLAVHTLRYVAQMRRENNQSKTVKRGREDIRGGQEKAATIKAQCVVQEEGWRWQLRTGRTKSTVV